MKRTVFIVIFFIFSAGATLALAISCFCLGLTGHHWAAGGCLFLAVLGTMPMEDPEYWGSYLFDLITRSSE